jgi:hypothetical protein
METAGGAPATACARAFAVFALAMRLDNSLLPASFCLEVD